MSERTIDITPNFKGIFKGMLAEAERQGAADGLFQSLGDEDRAQALRDVQRFFAPLAVAAQAISSVEEFEQLRAAMADIIAGVSKMAQLLENDLAETAAKWEVRLEEEEEEDAHDDV